MDEIQKIAKDLITYGHNPAAMQTIMLNQLKQSQSNPGMTLSDPTDPVVFLMEGAVTLVHSGIESNRQLMPKIYPSMSESYEDVYRHMSDRDFTDVFAQPSTAGFLLYLDTESILSRAMPLESKGIRRIVIPRDSYCKVSGYTFTLQYPIEIRVLPSGTFQVLWATDNKSPIKPITTNALDWKRVTADNGLSLICIEVPMMQYAITTSSDVITPRSSWSKSFAFTNKFFFARVWMRKDLNTGWVEMEKSFSKEVYNPNVPTAICRLDNQKLNVTIPAVYINKKLVSGDIRVDVYSTLGPLSINLENYSDFQLFMADLNGETSATYSNPFKTLSVKRMLSLDTTVGGRNPLTLEQLRDRVIANAVGARQPPITEAQLESTSNAMGLSLTKPIDFGTERTYHLSTAMPDSTLKEVTSPIGTVVSPFYFTWEELEALSTANINGNRATILPETIYYSDGVSIQADASMTAAWRFMSSRDLINAANQKPYFYSPFYYVVDRNNKSIDVRAYHLAEPSIDSKRFEATNDTTEVQVVTGSYEIVRGPDGYVLRLVTRSEDSYKALTDDQCFAQISYVPRGNTDIYAYLNGELIGYQDDERVWEFNIGTTLDIDRNDEMIINTFHLNENTVTPIPLPLTQEFNVFYGVSNYFPPEYDRHVMDSIITPPTRDAIGITWEMITIKLGDALTSYWCRSRPINDTVDYEHYKEDVYDTWAQDVIRKKDNGIPIFTYDENRDPPLEFDYEHRKGEVKLDAQGNPKVLHEAGSVIRDSFNNPIVANERKIKFRAEMAAYDARYLFATTDEVKKYRDAFMKYVVSICTSTMPEISKLLIDRSKAYFIPLTTMGYIDVRMGDGTAAPLAAENRFTVNYYLTAAQRNNNDLLTLIKSTTRSIINDWLSNNQTISIAKITSALGDALKDSIISVEMLGTGDDQDIRLFTVLSEASRAVVGKKLELEADGRIGLKDDIVQTFNRHDTKK